MISCLSLVSLVKTYSWYGILNVYEIPNAFSTMSLTHCNFKLLTVGKTSSHL